MSRAKCNQKWRADQRRAQKLGNGTQNEHKESKRKNKKKTTVIGSDSALHAQPFSSHILAMRG